MTWARPGARVVLKRYPVSGKGELVKPRGRQWLVRFERQPPRYVGLDELMPERIDANVE